MIKWIKVRNPYNEELTVTLTEAEPSHGLIVKEITGLGAHASLSFTDYVILDGSVNTNRRVEKRTIGLDFLLAFAPDIESSRRNVYRYFPIKGSIRLWIGTDYRTSYIDGIVESIEPGIFSENEEVNVSVVCEDPYFRSDHPVTDFDLDENFNGNNGKKFEFPFINNSLTEKQLEFSDESGQRTSPYSQSSAPYSTKVYELYYQGDIDTGATFKIYFDGTHISELIDLMREDFFDWIKVGVIIDNVSTGEQMIINLTDLCKKCLDQKYFIAGDHMIEVCTSKNKKTLTYYNGSSGHDDKSWPYYGSNKYENVMSGFFSKSNWIKLQAGKNVIKVGIALFNISESGAFSYQSFADKENIPSILLDYDILYQGV